MSSPYQVDVGGISALNVPIMTQPNREKECLLYSLSMCLRYCTDVHPTSSVQESSNYLSPADIKAEYIRIRDSGWAPTEEDMIALSDDLGILNLRLHYWMRSPPMGAFDDVVKTGIERDMPTIAVVDAKQIQGLNSEDGQHAIVITGISPTHVTIADPWRRTQKRLKREVVTDAWDTELNRMISIEASEQGSLGTLDPAAEPA